MCPRSSNLLNSDCMYSIQKRLPFVLISAPFIYASTLSTDLRLFISNAMPQLNTPRQEFDLKNIWGSKGRFIDPTTSCPANEKIVNVKVVECWGRRWSAAQDTE